MADPFALVAAGFGLICTIRIACTRNTGLVCVAISLGGRTMGVCETGDAFVGGEIAMRQARVDTFVVGVASGFAFAAIVDAIKSFLAMSVVVADDATFVLKRTIGRGLVGTIAVRRTKCRGLASAVDTIFSRLAIGSLVATHTTPFGSAKGGGGRTMVFCQTRHTRLACGVAMWSARIHAVVLGVAGGFAFAAVVDAIKSFLTMPVVVADDAALHLQRAVRGVCVGTISVGCAADRGLTSAVDALFPGLTVQAIVASYATSFGATDRCGSRTMRVLRTFAALLGARITAFQPCVDTIFVRFTGFFALTLLFNASKSIFAIEIRKTSVTLPCLAITTGGRWIFLFAGFIGAALVGIDPSTSAVDTGGRFLAFRVLCTGFRASAGPQSHRQQNRGC